MANEESDKLKPSLTLMKVTDKTTVEDVVDLFRRLTGRDPTQEDVEKTRQILDGDNPPVKD